MATATVRMLRAIASGVRAARYLRDGLPETSEVRRGQLGARELLEPGVGLGDGHDRPIAGHDPREAVHLGHADRLGSHQRVRGDRLHALANPFGPGLRRHRGGAAHVEQHLAVHFDRRGVDRLLGDGGFLGGEADIEAHRQREAREERRQARGPTAWCRRRHGTYVSAGAIGGPARRVVVLTSSLVADSS